MAERHTVKKGGKATRYIVRVFVLIVCSLLWMSLVLATSAQIHNLIYRWNLDHWFE